MMDDFDHIIKQLLANLPQHSPKSEVWNKINSSLDENIAMTRLRRMLKNNEHKPKTDLWPAIESSLNKPVFWKTFYQSAWVKFIVPSLIVLTTVFFIKPYISPDIKIAYNSPLQREINSAEIFSLNSDVVAGNYPVNISPLNNNNDLSTAENSNQNLYKNTNADMFNNKPAQLNSNQLPEKNSEQKFNNDLNFGNTDLAEVSEKISGKEFNKNIFLINPLSLFMFGSTALSDNKIISEKYLHQLPDVPLNKGLGMGNFSLEFSYAPEISYMNLKNNQEDYQMDVEKRKQAELTSYSWSAGIEGKIDFNHWFFQTGLNYSKISSVSEFRYTYSGIDTLGWHLDTMFIYLYIDSLGNCNDSISYSWSPLTGLVSYDKKKKASMQISYLQIPVMAGYSISRGKFQYSVSGGISLGIPLSISGRMIETDNYTISGVENQSLPLRKIVYSGLLRAGVNYIISPRYSIFAQPSINYTFNSVFDKEYPVNQKYITYGLRMGISYRF
ncbi:MAG: outer membrane beta-barrel protein [Bacteroidota bacterium]